MNKITKKTKISKIIENYPYLAKILADKYSLSCIGCMAAVFETIEQGARAHGMKDQEIKNMINKLNQSIDLEK